MDTFKLSDITGCISPITGETSGYDIIYNRDSVISYHKIDKIINFEDIFIVSVTFNNFVTLFKFESKSDRDNFFNNFETI